MSYNTLDSVVRSYIADTGRTTLHGYMRYMKWAMDGLKKWHTQNSYEDKVVLLPMDKKKAVAYPEDMVTWNYLGVKVGDRIAQFNRDKTISLHHSQSGNHKAVNTQYNPANQWPELASNFVNFYYEDAVNTVGFGAGSNGVGYFNDNNECKEFQFSSEVTSTDVILSYKSNGFNPTAETEVNEIAEGLLRDYIHWQAARFDKRYGDNSGETQMRKKEYGERYKEVRGQLMYITYEGILDILRRTTDINR